MIALAPRRNLLFSFSEHDLDIGARTLVGESSNDTLDGQVAVANVLVNRVQADWANDGKPDWWGEGLAGVCLAPWQFSCWNEKDPNRKRILQLRSTDPQYRRALATLILVADKKLSNNIHLCTHYHTLATEMPASWKKGPEMISFGSIGAHTFYYYANAEFRSEIPN